MSYVIADQGDIEGLTDNQVIGTPEMHDSKIVFSGKNNVLWCEDGVRLNSCVIKFNGDNGLVMLGRSMHDYTLKATLNNGCSVIIGRDVFFNGISHIIVSERRTVTIGDGCLMSFGVWIRTADAHLIYDSNTHERINPSRNIVIGDHVWIGQGSLILKGTFVGSGSIIGGMSVVSGKKIPSNSSWAGNPVRQVRAGIFWHGACVHTWRAKKTKQFARMDTDEFIFRRDETTMKPKVFVSKSSDVAERITHYRSVAYENAERNRLAYVPPKGNAMAKRVKSAGRAVKRRAKTLVRRHA